MEILDVLNEDGEIIGQGERKEVHEKGLWHIHVGAWLMNEKGELLLQKRSMEKKVNPGKWTRTGGHLDAGETPTMGIHREVAEEVGLSIPEEAFEFMEIKKKFEGKAFIYSYFAFTNAKIEDCKLQVEEVSDVKYITIEEFEKIYEEKNPNYVFNKWEEDYVKRTVEYFKAKRATLK